MNEILTNFKIKCDHIVKHKFDYEFIKDTQFDIISNIYINKQDVLGVLATGSGKSLCYQIFYYLYDSPIIVVSPLIALIYDQIYSLNKKGIYAVFVSSSNIDNNKLEHILSYTKNIIIYTTPEWISKNNKFLSKIIRKKKIELIAIDESHCISSWGHDFRNDYLKLDILKDSYPNINIMALTATATIKVKYEIISSLKLNNPIVIQSTFDRPNITINVHQTKDPFLNAIDFLKDELRSEFTIVYCQTRDDTKVISELIRHNITNKVDMYHAGMLVSDRNIVQEKFCTGEIHIIVSTVAFGMGIDQNIKYIIHWGMPKSLDNYWQEIGRAGRDGKESYSYLFYTKKDICRGNYFIKMEENEYLKAKKKDLWNCTKNYVLGNFCKRKYILNYFDETYYNVKCNKCNFCLESNDEYNDFTYELIDTVNFIKENNGLIMTSQLINKLTEQYVRSKEWWYSFIHALRDLNYIKIIKFPFDYFEYIESTNELLNLMKKYIDTNENIILKCHITEDIKITNY
jgi:ATP-dependent DNA helicase RecQ